jgi:hypothetical protein
MFRKGLRKITNFLLFGVVFTLVSYVTTHILSPGSNTTPGNTPLAFGDTPHSGGSDGSNSDDGCDSDSDSDCDSDGQ